MMHWPISDCTMIKEAVRDFEVVFTTEKNWEMSHFDLTESLIQISYLYVSVSWTKQLKYQNIN